MTGCAHPGIVEIVSAAAASGQSELVVGGFHLKNEGRTRIDAVVAQLQTLGVHGIAPTHCTGGEAVERFKAVFGERFVPTGVGTVMRIGEWANPGAGL